VVTGKGGTGKTTVTAALALAAARQGRRVIVAEMARDPQIPGLVRPGRGPVGYVPEEIEPGLHAMQVDPFEALAEYLGLQLGMQSLVDRVLGFEGFRQLMVASPGWRELITLGKVWHLEQMTDQDRPRYDLLLIDAPASGHGVTFLDVPRVVVSAVRAGPLRSHTERVEALVGDPDKTLLLPVALAEELPARETVELVESVRERLSIHVDRVVINAIHAAPFPAGLEDLDVRLARLPADLPIDPLPSPGTLATCARHVRARYELNRRYADEIERDTSLPTQRLPYLREGIDGPEALLRMGNELIGVGA
jgi:anion-transporting  ArsA/GET3 family ATPase